MLVQIPAAWLKAYPSLKPLGAWIRDLMARLDQLSKWATGDYPVVYWLSGFTYPTGFLTAVLQASLLFQELMQGVLHVTSGGQEHFVLALQW